jgi:hypothetical protein
MKGILIILISFFITVSCTKDIPTPNVKKTFIIGRTDYSDMIFKTIKDDSIKSITKLDLNQDGKEDINIGSAYYSSPNGGSGSAWINAKDSLFEFVIQKNNRNLKFGDTVTNDMDWKKGKFIINEGHTFIPSGVNTYNVYWNAEDPAYIGIRYLKENNRFSWIKVLNGGTRVKQYGILK